MSNYDNFQFIRSNTFKPENDDNDNINKDGFEVLLNGFLYYRNKKNKNSTYWTCKHPKCKAFLSIDHNGRIINQSKADHNLKTLDEVDNQKDVHQPLTHNEILALNFTKKVKERCSSEDVGACKISEDTKNKNFGNFLDYFVNNFFEGRFSMDIWNHYDTNGPRTNNNLESYNRKLKAFMDCAHPNIFKSIEFFQLQETSAFVKYVHANEGKPAPPRKKLDIGKDNNLCIYKKLEQHDISIESYLKYGMPLFTFRQNKNSEKAAFDTDSSDGEDLDSSEE
ncbi:unnamed protein product [Brachionus calyciflorus]|uniref:FLYWCH-type domain-containing protein n=1 Tax=Brachionus calyciflorus TaxID=104777 RepID=A0A813XVY6_9BILA|nr:unnamed protein product [Brachionus calyciflorus]